MPPKFQSTFIPKGPVSSDFQAPLGRPASSSKDIVSLLVNALFAVSVVLSIGVFAYKYYLNYRIGQMGIDLENARATLAPETVTELVRLNDRIVSTQQLINKHRIVSPIFDFLEVSTPKTVRYTDFTFTDGDDGLELKIRGEAKGYAAVALLSQILDKNESLKDTVFADLRLDDKGNVSFSVDTKIGESALSYSKAIDKVGIPATTPTAPVVVSTSTPASTTQASSTNSN